MDPTHESRCRRGVWLFPSLDAGSLVDAVCHAEAVGLDEIWIGDEGVARDPMTVFAAAAMRTSRIRLCLGITTPVLRHPGALAASAATVAELSGGRFVLGLGIGGSLALDSLSLTPASVEQLEDGLDIARRVLRSAAGDGYDPPPHAIGPVEVDLWVGARGPRLVQSAAARADGLFLSGCTSAEQDGAVDRARAIDPMLEIALYRSAGTQPSDRTTSWHDITDRIEADIARHRPAAVGINLVDLNDGQGDARVLIDRAATILASV